MKQLRWLVKVALLPVFVLVFGGCETTHFVDNGPRFHEAAAADVVLRFAQWDYIIVTQPDYREDGFIRRFRREELSKAFDDLGLRRDTAVVVVGWTYQEEKLNQVMAEWKNVLRESGFRRVICLRGSYNSKIDGLPVLDDTNSSTFQPKQHASL